MTAAAAFAMLAQDTAISTRAGVTLTFSDGTIHRFVRDAVEREIDSVTYAPVPYGEVSSLSTRPGSASDKLEVVLDGGAVIEGAALQAPEVTALFASLSEFRLLNARMDLHLIVLDPCDDQPVGRIHKFAGLVDSAVLDREDPTSPKFTIQALSYRVRLRKPDTTVYSDVDQGLMYANDRSLRHMADSEFRNGQFIWNKEFSGSGGGRTFPSRDPANTPRFDIRDL